MIRLVVIPGSRTGGDPADDQPVTNLIKNSFGAAIAYPGWSRCSCSRRWSPPPRRSDHRHYARPLSRARPRRLVVHELVQRPPSPGDAMSARRPVPAGSKRSGCGCSPAGRHRRVAALPLCRGRISLPLVDWLLVEANWRTAPRGQTAPAPALAGCSSVPASPSSCTASIRSGTLASICWVCWRSP